MLHCILCLHNISRYCLIILQLQLEDGTLFSVVNTQQLHEFKVTLQSSKISLDVITSDGHLQLFSDAVICRDCWFIVIATRFIIVIFNVFIIYISSQYNININNYNNYILLLFLI